MTGGRGTGGADPAAASLYDETPVADDALLVARELEVRFAAPRGIFGRRGEPIRAVAGVSLHLRPGETLGLVGESGCGKSTTARALLRLVEPTGGSVRFEGRDVSGLEGDGLRAFRRRAQIVFQDPFGSLNPRLTVGAAIAEVLRVHGLGGSGAGGRRQGVERLLERVGLRSEHAGRFPHELSGGQRQRAGIARALAVEPDLLVCDEPVSALDVSVQAQILNLLADLRDDLGLSLLLIAHDLAVVEHMSERVAVMYAGRIVETGPVEAVYGDPRHPYTRALLSAVPRLDPGGPGLASRTVLAGDAPRSGHPAPGCPFRSRCPHPARDRECAVRAPPLERKSEGRYAACVKEPPDSPGEVGSAAPGGGFGEDDSNA